MKARTEEFGIRLGAEFATNSEAVFADQVTDVFVIILGTELESVVIVADVAANRSILVFVTGLITVVDGVKLVRYNAVPLTQWKLVRYPPYAV